MTVRPRLDLRQQARITLSPQMRQSLAVLRMPAADLAERLAQAAAENPFLLLTERRPAGGSAYDVALATVAAEPGLIEGIIHQLRARSLDPGVRAVAEYLAGELREDGYLDGQPEELAAALGLPGAQVAAGLEALQSCDPPGIGARDLAECLELQLVDRGLDRPLARAVVGELDEIVAGRIVPVARRLDLPEAEVRRLGGLVRGLSPHPVRADEGMTAVLRPDLRVRRGADGNLTVGLSGDLPALRLDQALVARAGANFDARGRGEAEGLIRAVHQRGETLLAIGRAIAAHQAAFFTEGPDRLRPLRRADLAAELGLHPSTLGRAVAAKGLEAEGRIYPLSFFFSPPATSGDLSSFVLARTIARMIAEEPSDAPLSDAEIAGRLALDGVDIARRTVAKYRDGMKIPSSRRRRRPGMRLADGG